MRVNMIELFFVLVCLRSSGVLTCNECRQLQDERYTINCNNTCVEDQNETGEEPGNCTEVDKEMEPRESTVKRPSWHECEQRQNETEKPTNCGRFLGRNKRQEKVEGESQLTCQMCRITEKEGKRIDCEDICATVCRYCEERKKITRENCNHVCGDPPLSCGECRRKEKQKQPVDCEFSCANSCHDCEKNQGTTGEDCDGVCGRPRLPCEQCRREEEEDETVNCEWTCENSCIWCEKMEKRTGIKHYCGKYCGPTPLRCLECRRNAMSGEPVDCGKKCAKPCLECRKANRSGRVVDCKEICESSCFGCRVNQRLTGKLGECDRYCGERSKTEVKVITAPPLSCGECRRKEKKGEPVSCDKICAELRNRTGNELPEDCEACRSQEEQGGEYDCEFICDGDCRHCEERQRNTNEPQYCERPCGLPPQPCRTCRKRENKGEILNCEWTCAFSCIMCERMEELYTEENCERFCGHPRLPCRACRRSEKEGHPLDCSNICQTPCRECRDDQRSSTISQQCEMFCGVPVPVPAPTPAPAPAPAWTSPAKACADCRRKQEEGEPIDCDEVCGPESGGMDAPTTCVECLRRIQAGELINCGRICYGADTPDITYDMTCEDCLAANVEHPILCTGICKKPSDPLGYVECVSCNGLTQPACNVPFQDREEFTIMCEFKCEIATFFKTGTRPQRLRDKYVIRGCTGVSESVPHGYIVDHIEPCDFLTRCNGYDSVLFAPSSPATIESMDTIHQKTSATASHRISIQLTWLLFTYHSVPPISRSRTLHYPWMCISL